MGPQTRVLHKEVESTETEMNWPILTRLKDVAWGKAMFAIDKVKFDLEQILGYIVQGKFLV